MRSLLEQLENNEAILLMYLAGELPEADRAEVEQMLARDPALQRELEYLQSLSGEVAQMLGPGELAGQEAGNVRGERVVGRASAQIHRFAEERNKPVRIDVKPQPRRFRLAWALYPVAAAAVLVLGMLWWGRAHVTGPTNPDQFVVMDRETPVIFRDESQNENLAGLRELEDQAIRLAAGDEDPLGFRTWGRQ